MMCLTSPGRSPLHTFAASTLEYGKKSSRRKLTLLRALQLDKAPVSQPHPSVRSCQCSAGGQRTTHEEQGIHTAAHTNNIQCVLWGEGTYICQNSVGRMIRLRGEKCLSLQPFEEVRKQAEAALAEAANFLPALDDSEQEIASLEKSAKEAAE